MPEKTPARSRSEALLLKRKTYQGNECKAHKGNFTRYSSNGSCVLCSSYSTSTRSGKVSGYIAKKADTLAFMHKVSPWPVTSENLAMCPDLTPGKGICAT